MKTYLYKSLIDIVLLLLLLLLLQLSNNEKRDVVLTIHNDRDTNTDSTVPV